MHRRSSSDSEGRAMSDMATGQRLPATPQALGRGAEGSYLGVIGNVALQTHLHGELRASRIMTQ